MRHGIGIIKGIWGDETLRRHRIAPLAFEKYKVDAMFCYGGQNKMLLRDMGYIPIKLHDKLWATSSHRYNATSYHKLKIMEAAFQHFPNGILWVDFDITQTHADIEWIYDDLAQGKPLRASLYVHNDWTRCAGWRHDSQWNVSDTYVCPTDSYTAARIVLGCGFLFIRQRELIQQALEIQNEYPEFLDHQVVSLLFDRMQGGYWIGPERFVNEGWHTNGYYYRKQLYPPRRSQIVFQAGTLKKERRRRSIR